MKQAKKLRATIAALAQAGAFRYTDHLEFARIAGDEGDWTLALEQAEQALILITPQTVGAEYPTAREVRAEKLEEDTCRVRQTALLMKGWALVRLGKTEEGTNIFRDVENDSSYNYLGLPENALNSFWGRTLIRQGNYSAAIERLAPGALIANREPDLEVLGEAYSSLYGSLDGFEHWCAEKQRDLAPPVQDFTLADYGGSPFHFSDLAGRVVYIMFWFPACAGCKDKLPQLEPLWRHYRGKGFTPVAIDAFADVRNGNAFIKEHDITYPMLANDKDGDNLVGNRFRVRVFPVSYLIDRRGRIRSAWDWQHEFDAGALEEFILRLLDEKPD